MTEQSLEVCLTFARLNYDFDSKYYLMFTMRADGSSKYQDKWGYFPSVGASLILTVLLLSSPQMRRSCRLVSNEILSQLACRVCRWRRSGYRRRCGWLAAPRLSPGAATPLFKEAGDDIVLAAEIAQRLDGY